MASEEQRAGLVKSSSLSFSPLAHTTQSILKAAYRFCHMAAFDVAPSSDAISCQINFLKPVSAEESERIINDFKIEVLDQGLRSQIADETSASRNAILALAFSKTGLQGGE